jgi:uncharacterized damage-inducible protein DinB
MSANSGNNVVIPVRPAPDDPSRTGPERDMLMSFLDYFRAVLVRKCAGVTAGQLQATVAASSLTLGRLLRHMTLVEDHWFQHVLHDREMPEQWRAADWEAQPDWEMDTAAEYSPTALAAHFDDAVARSRDAIDGIDLDRIAAVDGRHGPTTLRWIMIHMVEEYARHCGHADLLREAIDGTVGD